MTELKIEEIEIANNSLTINNNTGVYDAVNNPGGFGTPNLDREDLKLYLHTIHVDKDGNELVVNPAAYSPVSVEAWTESGILDGIKQHFIIGIDQTANIPTDTDVYAFILASDLDTISNGDTVDIAGTNYTIYITKTITFPIPQARLDRIEANEQVENSGCDADRAENQEFYDLLRMSMESAVHNFNMENYVRAQTIIEKANEIGEQLYAEL